MRAPCATRGCRIGTPGWPGARVAKAHGEGMTPSPHSVTVAALAALAASAIAAAPAAASIPVEGLAAATPVAAYGATAMWSRLDTATGKYQLVQSIAGGAPTLVGVPQRDGPFDVDLGSNRNGATYAVYTRGGDVYRLNPRAGVETKVLSSPDHAERSPTIQRGRIAFVRRAGGMDQLRIGDTSSGTNGTRMVLSKPLILAVELGNKHVAWVDNVATLPWSSRTRVHIRNVATSRDHVVYLAGSGGASWSVVTKPSFTSDGSAFVWARSRIGAAGSRIVKYSLDTSTLSYAQGSPLYGSVSWVDDKLGALVSTSIAAGSSGAKECDDAGVRYCNVQYTGPLSFNLKP